MGYSERGELLGSEGLPMHEQSRFSRAKVTPSEVGGVGLGLGFDEVIAGGEVLGKGPDIGVGMGRGGNFTKEAAVKSIKGEMA
jgi:hypothetical protein